jgi:uncharacterized protein (TIGR02246 family)
MPHTPTRANALLALAVIALALSGRTVAADGPTEEAAVRKVLDDQVAAWNKGDLDGFMAGYWNDEGLSFISNGAETTGWKATKERYVKRYKSEGKEMGRLSFGELKVEVLGPAAGAVRGQFTLVTSKGTDTGRFTLVFRKLADGWKITHDHTSVACPPEKK